MSITGDTTIRIVLHSAEVVQLDTQEIIILYCPPTHFRGVRLRDYHKAFTKLRFDLVLLAEDSPCWAPSCTAHQPKQDRIKTLLIGWPGPPHKWTCGCTVWPRSMAHKVKSLVITQARLPHPLCLAHSTFATDHSPEHKSFSFNPAEWQPLP